MLEIIFYPNSIPIISENALTITHRFNYGDITEKIPEYDDYVKAVNGETEIRVWYTNWPVELSGFYWFCNLLVDIGYKGNLYTEESCKTVGLEKWNLTTEEVHKVINDRNLLSYEEIKQNSLKWEKLCGENSEFRILKKDELISDIPDASNGLTISEKTVLKTMRALHVTTKKAKAVASIIGQALCQYPKITCNDAVTLKIIKKLAESETPYIVIHCPKEYDLSNYMYCGECMFTNLGYSYTSALRQILYQLQSFFSKLNWTKSKRSIS